MRILAISLTLMLTACAGSGEKDIVVPKPPENIEKEEVLVPVPVPCKANVERPVIAIESVKEGEHLEKQNAVLRQTVAQQRAYTVDLEAAIRGCGGNIK